MVNFIALKNIASTYGHILHREKGSSVSGKQFAKLVSGRAGVSEEIEDGFKQYVDSVLLVGGGEEANVAVIFKEEYFDVVMNSPSIKGYENVA